MLKFLLLFANLLNSVLGDDTVPTFNRSTVPTYDSGLPDTAPYNFMFTAFERSVCDKNNFSRFVIPIESRHKKTRLVYNTNNEIIGFDLYIRGQSCGMEPLSNLERVSAYAEYSAIILGLPMSPNAWTSTELTQTYKPKEFTKREKFMFNMYSDFYCRFRNPSGKYAEATKAVVNRLNKGHDISFNGITNVTNFNITSNVHPVILKDLFSSKAAGTVYLDAEYENPSILEELHARGHNNGVLGLFVPSIVGLLSSFFLMFILCLCLDDRLNCLYYTIVPITALWCLIWSSVAL